ncbi:Pentatricopeptide repeat [Dillenia turbinata]|uniref:Pentatricopeptide repeat n=1 Tax=Dillenia turbinata TaxID=194707 RepID=A0AAN8ZC45_9MAGN
MPSLNLNITPLLKNTTTSLFKPNPLISSSLKDIVKVLKLSADSKNLNLGKIIHAQLIITNQVTENNLIQVNSLINFYAKSGKISIGRQLFDQMRERNVVSWSALMAGCLHNGFTLEVIELFRNMLLMGNVRPNEYILATVLSGCCERGAVNLGRQTHGYAVKSGLMFHQYVKNALIYLYSMNLDAKVALQILNSVPGLDNSSYNSIIKGFLEQGCLMEAVKILFRMLEDCVPWDKVTYVSAFGLCAGLKNLRWGMQVHCYAMKMNVEFDVFVNSAVIDMYGKCGRARYARNVFDGVEDQNVVCWTAVMGAYLQNACFEEAINLLCEMDASDIQPNDYTLAVLLNCCAGLSALKHGELLHARAEKMGFRNHVIVANALINMYAKSGNIKAANRVFSHMSYQDLVTWNSMISGYSHHGLGREALAVFYDMLAADEPPNYVTFVGVLAACGHLGLVEEGFYYLNHLMKKNGVKPGLEHYTCILGLLCKAGKLHAAQEFMNTSPVQWDVVAWRTLLNACHIHRDFAKLLWHLIDMKCFDGIRHIDIRWCMSFWNFCFNDGVCQMRSTRHHLDGQNESASEYHMVFKAVESLEAACMGHGI